jgi:tRNA (guanine37-N1)-methyltransferase
VVSLFPESLHGVWDASILSRARKTGLLEIDDVQLRDFATDKHRSVDDSPSGGGPGLVLRVDVVTAALREAVRRDDERGPDRRRRVIFLDAAGKRFTQEDAARLATYDHLVLLCGRYEGIDARAEAYVDEALCIGDYVLTGGELAAAVILDATARELPGALGNEASSAEESHRHSRLEHRQYTRPNEFEGRRVPEVLLCGDHGRIARARQKDGLARTLERRPDLVAQRPLEPGERRLLDDDKVPLLVASEAP